MTEILLDAYLAYIVIGHGIEVDTTLTILESLEGVGTRLFYFPLAGTIVATCDIYNQTFLIVGTEGITMEATTQG